MKSYGWLLVFGGGTLLAAQAGSVISGGWSVFAGIWIAVCVAIMALGAQRTLRDLRNPPRS